MGDGAAETKSSFGRPHGALICIDSDFLASATPAPTEPCPRASLNRFKVDVIGDEHSVPPVERNRPERSRRHLLLRVGDDNGGEEAAVTQPRANSLMSAS